MGLSLDMCYCQSLQRGDAAKFLLSVMSERGCRFIAPSPTMSEMLPDPESKIKPSGNISPPMSVPHPLLEA